MVAFAENAIRNALGLEQPIEKADFSGQDRPPVAAKPGRGRAAARTHPPHELHRRRRAHLETQSGLPDRAPLFNRPHDPLAKVMRQRGRHGRLTAKPPAD